MNFKPDTTSPDSPDEIGRTAALVLASDLVEQSLALPFDGFRAMMIKVRDSGLIRADAPARPLADLICDYAEKLAAKLGERFPLSRFERAQQMRQRAASLVAEVEVYRQEAFWCSNNAMTSFLAEECVRELFTLYHLAESLVVLLDANVEDRVFQRNPAPAMTPNCFEKL